MKRKQKVGPVSYYVRRTATHCASGETSIKSFGPFATFQQAEAFEREDGKARGEQGYDYGYRIDPVPTPHPAD